MKFLLGLLFSCLVSCSLVRANPVCIPHHAGEGDWPSNTLYAIKAAHQAGFAIINVTLELSKDNHPFAYHGFKLEQFTNGTGDPEALTLQQLQSLDAAYFFKTKQKYLLRNQAIKIAGLPEILAATSAQLILDLKSQRNNELVHRVVNIINNTSDPAYNWQRIIFYSTDATALKELKRLHPTAHIFLDRPTTFKLLLTQEISPVVQQQLKATDWIGFELFRELQVCESFTLGQDCININKKMWDEKIIKQIKAINPNIKIVLFNIDSTDNYQIAQTLDVYGIYTDAPLDICPKTKI